ncbi:MAG: hypothetical protein ACK559_40150, partial [bacterium]
MADVRHEVGLESGQAHLLRDGAPHEHHAGDGGAGEQDHRPQRRGRAGRAALRRRDGDAPVLERAGHRSVHERLGLGQVLREVLRQFAPQALERHRLVRRVPQRGAQA